MNKNLFIVTRLGQLRNVHSYIKQFNAKDNCLIILYVPDNIDLLENLKRNIQSESFEEVLYIELPLKPLSVSLKKNKRIYEGLEEKVLYLTDKYQIENIFVCNTDNYYVYLEQFARRYNQKLILFEEGLTTYRMFSSGSYRYFSKADVKSAFKYFLKSVRKSIISFLSFSLKLLSWIFNINFFDFVKHNRIMKKYRYGHIKHFDEAYVSFPDKLRDLDKSNKIGEIHKLDFYVNENIDSDLVQRLENKMVIFANQRYAPYDKHFEIVFDLLEKNGYKKVFFKFHPKEESSKYLLFLEKARQSHPNLEIVILKGMNHIPLEDLVATGKVDTVISITSSALAYIPLINNQVKTFSIADSYEEKCRSKKYYVETRKMDLFYRDYRAFKEVFDIIQI